MTPKHARTIEQLTTLKPLALKLGFDWPSEPMGAAEAKDLEHFKQELIKFLIEELTAWN